MNKRKTKVKLLLFILLSAIGLIAGFFFAGYVNLLLSGGSMDDVAALAPALLWAGVMSDERHRLLTLGICFVIVAGIAALLLMSRKETFESDTTAVAGEIQTPVAIGQGQHGTARWLKPSERAKAFALYRLDGKNSVFAALLSAGNFDRKDIKDDEEKNEH
jgi:type IV secretion system protein VirD4